MGLPRFFGRVGQGLGTIAGSKTAATDKVGDDDVAPDEDDLGDAPDLGIEWSVAYYVLLFVGAYAFKALLFPLTDSDLALAEF